MSFLRSQSGSRGGLLVLSVQGTQKLLRISLFWFHSAASEDILVVVLLWRTDSPVPDHPHSTLYFYILPKIWIFDRKKVRTFRLDLQNQTGPLGLDLEYCTNVNVCIFSEGEVPLLTEGSGLLGVQSHPSRLETLNWV